MYMALHGECNIEQAPAPKSVYNLTAVSFHPQGPNKSEGLQNWRVASFEAHLSSKKLACEAT